MLRSVRIHFFVALALVWFVGESFGNNLKTIHPSNEAIFNRLGLAPIQIQNGHHKKRLAGPEPAVLLTSQSGFHQPYNRRHDQHDSHIYTVKLPASPPYYTITKPHKLITDDKIEIINHDTISTKSNEGVASATIHHQAPSVGFHSNGKPAKIYHWNLPVVKKANEKKRLHTLARLDQMRKKLELKILSSDRRHQTSPPSNTIKSLDEKKNLEKTMLTTNDVLIQNDKSTLIKHPRNNDKRLNYPNEIKKTDDNITNKNDRINETHNKVFRSEDSTFYNVNSYLRDYLLGWSNDLHATKNIEAQKSKKHRKKAAMSYYAPISSKTGSTSIHKDFSGNGKPKAFYVMEKSRKPVYYHPLLP